MARTFARLLPLRSTLLVLLAAPPAAAPVAAQSSAGTSASNAGAAAAPAAFEVAVARGTRSDDGRPGSAYWQNGADYRIDATLDPATGRLTGRETIRYHNRSPDALDRLVLHLDQNVFAPGARRNRRAPITGGMTVTEVRVDGELVEGRHPGGGYQQALTLLELRPATPVAPGATSEIEVAWSFTVPPAPTFRNGNLDDVVFAVAQWYPRMAVYDDVYGWDMTPYLGDGEFYLEYGDFDLALTVPSGWLIGATGVLTNPQEVLTPATLRRLAQARSRTDETVQVVPADERGPGRATLGDEGSMLTWRFRADDVRDVAFSTSDEYVWDVRTTAAGVEAQALYRPEFESWSETARYAAFTIETLSEWIRPYPWPQVTITEGPVGGMEYPMLVFNPSGTSPRGNAGVTIHETAHQWFPMMVGSMEAKHAFMDEGFVSYFDEEAAAVLWGEDAPRWGENQSYLRVAGTEQEVPLLRHTDLVSPYGARGLAAYTKPAVMLGALREIIGRDAFESAFREYAEAWAFKHPQPWDFFNLVERHAGQDLDWFWGPAFGETATLDVGVRSLQFSGGETRIELSHNGGLIVPVPVRITMDDGSVEERTVGPERWLDAAADALVGQGGRTLHLAPIQGTAVRVEVDPEGLFADVDRGNNVWGGG